MAVGVIVGQTVAAWLLGFVLVYGFGIGNGWELVAIPLGMSVGVWGVGAVFDRTARTARRFLMTLVASGLGMGIPVLQPIGFAGILLPLVGAFLGYWVGGQSRS